VNFVVVVISLAVAKCEARHPAERCMPVVTILRASDLIKTLDAILVEHFTMQRKIQQFEPL